MRWQSHSMQLATPSRQFWNWGPLIFSGFYFLPLVNTWHKVSTFNLIMQVVIYLVFVGLYAVALYQRGARVFPILVLMFSVCSIGSFFTYGTHSMFGFIAYFCGFSFLFPFNLLMLALLLAVVGINAVLILPEISYFYLGPAGLLSIGLFAFGWMEQRERVHRKKEKQSQEQLEQLAAIAERERIARDLHDVLGHSLASIALKAELANKLLLSNQTERAQSESAQVAQLARELLSEVREAVSGLKAKGLRAEVDNTESLLKSKAIDVEIELDEVALNAKQETTLAMVLREATTNIIKHSSAQHVSLKLWQEQNNVHFQISDNGTCQLLKFGNGLNGIKERVEALAGDINLSTGKNVTMTVRLPV
ncbi:sensor histidine kinase [Pseudoalteromonas xiamenensis]